MNETVQSVAEMLKEYCRGRVCTACLFANQESTGRKCRLTGTPESWQLKEEGTK